MDSSEIQMPRNHRAALDRFAAACRADESVVAAFLGGSYARGTADAYSDLDLGLITTDAAYEEFYAGREEFVRLVGMSEAGAVFLESFDLPENVFFVFSDGTEGELALGRESRFDHIHAGPYTVLLDKKGILAGAVFRGSKPDREEQVETLRRLVYWFWHDLSHFITAMGRGYLWWGQGQLEELRRLCVNLARLRQSFAAPVEGYEKLEGAVPIEQLSPLEATFCALERGAMLQAAHDIVQFYRDVAPPLARAQGIAYPDALDRLTYTRLERLLDTG